MLLNNLLQNGWRHSILFNNLMFYYIAVQYHQAQRREKGGRVEGVEDKRTGEGLLASLKSKP